MRTRPAMAEEVGLIVQADDYGASRSITDGILHCFEAGVVTQASIMPPAPDAVRGARLARRAGLPLGVHLTLACEWGNWRYYPLTAARSLRDADGGFLPNISDLRSRAVRREVEIELRAQLAWARAMCIEVCHVDSHIGVYEAEMLASLGVPSRDLNQLGLDSLWHLSLQPYDEKVDRLVEHVHSLSAGRHMIVAHPALDGLELTGFCSPESRRWKWARDIRVSDLGALTDPRFLGACVAREVTLAGPGSD